MSAPVPGTPLPWAWASEDHSALILGGADDYITHCVMWVSPCEACQDRSETKQWEWGACTTPSEQDAAYIVHAANNFPALLEALQVLAQAEAQYRLFHDLKGAGDIETGRAWDRMRRAGNSARQAIASATGEA